MKSFFCFILFSFSSLHLFAQNLVVDSSFQKVDTVYHNQEKNYILKHWQQLDSELPLKPHFLANKKAVPNSSYIEIAYHYRPPSIENHCFYTVGKLKEPLKKGTIYTINLRLKLPASADVSSNDLGIGFLNSIQPHSPFKRLNIPSAVLQSDIVDSKEWVNISGRYVARGGEKHIILGNFRPQSDRQFKVERYSLNTKHVAKVGKVLPWAYMQKFPFGTTYYVDEVNVSPSKIHFVDTLQASSLIGTKLFQNIHFKSYSAVLDSTSLPTLATLVQLLKQNPEKRIHITGHTDNIGDKHLNLKLSRARAISIAKFLVAKGIPKTRISVNGKGETYPIASNKTAAGRSINRRVEIQFHESSSE